MTYVWTPDRLDRTRAGMQALGIEGLLVTHGSDLRYLAGYDAIVPDRLTCFVLPLAGDPVLVAPFLEAESAARSAAGIHGIEIRTWGETDDAAAVAVSALARGVQRVALSGRTWFDHAVRLQEALGGATLVSATPLLAELRMRKTPEEVAAVRAAAESSDRMFAALASGDVPVLGRTERALYGDLRDLLVQFGHVESEGNLASGPNTGNPHHQAGERIIAAGDPLFVDIAGTMPDGYRSDCTRTFAVGALPDDEFVRIHALVNAANAAGFEAARPGSLASEVDRAAREHIVDGGYGPRFVHRTGHGIGLDIHEAPFIVAGDDTRLDSGMCFSIEPGVYLPGRYGVRIEDIVTITDVGVERLNRTSHELAVIPA